MKANKFMFGAACLALLAASSCKNSEVSFPDFEGGTSVYFAYQSPVRTIVLGEDTYNTDRDQNHTFRIGAVSGGTYSHGISATVPFAEDASVINGVFLDPLQKEAFPAERLMPSSYYSIDASSFEFKKSVNAYVDVKLNDAFFQDPKSCQTYYAIPLKMTSVQGADRIIEDKSWTLYFVKYVNKFSGVWMRRGMDVFATASAEGTPVKSENIRHKGVEKDDTLGLRTVGLNSVVYTIPVINADGKQMQDHDKNYLFCDIQLDFNGDECTMKSLTDNITVEGKGKFGDKTEILAWGNKDRDGIYLDYTMKVGAFSQIATKDTLVLQTRNVKASKVSIY